jgi:hypothetical protein
MTQALYAHMNTKKMKIKKKKSMRLKENHLCKDEVLPFPLPKLEAFPEDAHWKVSF